MAHAAVRRGGLVLRVAGKVTTNHNCCCEAGCCDNQLESGVTVLQAELTADATGCFTLNETMCMDDGIGTGIWTSGGCHGAGFFDVACWKGLSLTCDGTSNTLQMIWDSSGSCPLIDTSSGGNWGWRLVSSQCDPFEFVFEYDINENSGMTPGCNCDCSTSVSGTVVGTVQVTITIL